MLPKAVRLVTIAWGEQHVNDMLDCALASAMAPGNLPVMARDFDCTVAVVTEASLFDLVWNSDTGRRIREVCTLKLISLDDLLAESWQYGMTLTRALFRGMEDVGPAMTETYFLFLNADFVLADGCYERLVPRIRAGERLHLAPSYCTNEEDVWPILQARLDRGVLKLLSRDLASIILKNRHHTIKAKTVNQDKIEFEHTDQFYWAVNETTLLGHQMPIAVIGMQPTVALKDVTTFWDWGLIYDFFPEKPLCVVGDSDEFLMLEMRPRMRSSGSVLFGRSSPEDVAKRMTGYITQYQVDNARFPLTLHSKDLPPDVTSARHQLKSYVDTVLKNLPSKPIDHCNHTQWLYHKRYYRQRLARRFLNSDHLRRGANANFALVSYDQPKLSWKSALARRLVSIGHLYDDLIKPLKAASEVSLSPMRILIVGELGSPLLDLLDGLPGLQTHLTPDLVLNGALTFLPKQLSRFDYCLVETPSGDLAEKTTELVEAVLRHLTAKSGRISLIWSQGFNSSQRVPITTAVEFMIKGGVDVELQYWASPIAAFGHRGMRLATGHSRWGRIPFVLRLPAFFTAALLLILSKKLRRTAGRRPFSDKPQRYLGRDCVGLMINLKPLSDELYQTELTDLPARQAKLPPEPEEAKPLELVHAKKRQ